AATEEAAITEEPAETCSTDEAAITAELVTESAKPAESNCTDETAITEEPTDDQDAVTEALEDEIESFATEADLTEILEQEEIVAPDDDASDNEPADSGTKLNKLSVTELQTRYLEVVGRPTGSSHKRYLVWKIREAQKGRIPVGQRAPRSATTEGTDAEIKILPLRMESSLVEQLDAARERLGLKSRMDLFRKALGAYLAGVGEIELAAAFSTEA
ncbi:MAG: hypothetical protein OEY28_08745, partial [Nitrospira sp.]|nr:hypothetical protein [Nitrospira sp.]